MIMNRRNFCTDLSTFLGFSIHDSYARANNNPRCGVKDVMGSIFEKKSKWGKNHLTYYIHGRDHGDLPRTVWDNEFRLAFDAWSEITPLVFEETIRQRQADIVISVGRRWKESFGVRGGVLAWAEMPSSNDYDGVLWTKFDLAEKWVLPEDWIHGAVLRSVAAHEIGHLLGLDHSNDEDALMYPYINNALKPRDDDITKIQKLYGPLATIAERHLYNYQDA